MGAWSTTTLFVETNEFIMGSARGPEASKTSFTFSAFHFELCILLSQMYDSKRHKNTTFFIQCYDYVYRKLVYLGELVA